MTTRHQIEDTQDSHFSALRDAVRFNITRLRHAAHTGPGSGWDLEQIDVQADKPPTSGLPDRFEFHSGYRDAKNRQHWIFYRHAPLSPGMCERCIEVKP